MKRLLLHCTLVAIGAVAASSIEHTRAYADDKRDSYREKYDVLSCGQMPMRSSGSKRLLDIRYEYLKDRYTGRHELRIGSSRQPIDAWYCYLPEIGQEFLISAYPVNFPATGHLLFTEWGWGASGTQLMVFAISADGKIESVFKEACRFGFRAADVTGDGTPELCGGFGDVAANNIEMRVFAWTGKGFRLARTMSVLRAHVYSDGALSPEQSRETGMVGTRPLSGYAEALPGQPATSARRPFWTTAGQEKRGEKVSG